MQKLDLHEEAIWLYVAQYKMEHDGRAPSVDEIGQTLGLPKNHVWRDLRKLVAAGYIRLIKGVARGIVLLKSPDGFGNPSGMVRLPLWGIVHAGAPIPTPDQNSEPLEMIDVARNLVGNKENTYLLRVKGDSMIDALVNDGDLLVMEQTRVAENGDMVAVWIKSKHATTLKTINIHDGWVTLRPANPTLREKKYRASDIEIQGRVLSILRDTQRGAATGTIRVR